MSLVTIDYRNGRTMPWTIVERHTGRVLGAANTVDAAEELAERFDAALRRQLDAEAGERR